MVAVIDQRYLFPDRLGHIDRACSKKRDSHRRVRQRTLQRRNAASRICPGSSQASIPAYHHDVARIYPGRRAARPRLRSRRGQPEFDRNGRFRGNAGRHLSGYLFCPALFRGSWKNHGKKKQGIHPGKFPEQRGKPAVDIGAAGAAVVMRASSPALPSAGIP